MSQRKITVSDGTNFFLIPVSDIHEACADGFYIPAQRERTIVSDGKHIFEIPVADLPAAMADGFFDILTVERELVREFHNQIATPDLENSVPTPAEKFPPVEPPELKFAESEWSDEESAAQALQTAEDTSEEPVTLKMRLQRLLHPNATQRRRLAVLVTNVAVHVGVIFILAAILLPSEIKEEFMTITSTFEPETAETKELEMMELDQPVELSESTPPAETFIDSPVESMSIVDVNINDLDLASIQTAMDVSSTTASAMAATEFGGRSKAGRSAMVAKMGGSAASEKAVQEGLTWLAHHQGADGGWSFDHTGGECKNSCDQAGSLGVNCRNAATGMAILAMLGAGNTPFQGDFQESVLNGVKFLLAHSSAAPAGLDLRGQHAGNTGMYTHAIAATALCETLSMLKHEVTQNLRQDEDRTANRQRITIIRQLEPAAAAAIKFIVNAQSPSNGSWGYDPGNNGDTSILGWQMMALKSAVHAEIPVSPNAVRGANLFLDQVQAENGFYGYQSAQDAKPSTTAIGLVCRMLSGVSREEPRLKMAVEALSAAGPDPGNMYYNYYATQVMLHYGGETWDKWNSVMREHLVSTQQSEGHVAGSWNISDAHGGAAGRLYMTCLCTMTLEVYYRHLPLYGIPEAGESDSGVPDADKKDSKSKKK
ncbi:MAG: terpene cyclase/mutase family protein [Planctomycetales bacterium]|nr:terpene cyclase/mutase family protein [Planctomycetales bacterium]